MRPDPDAVAESAVDLRTGQAHSARVYDFILGGKDNFPADRAAAESLLAEWPALRVSMQQNRAFMRRVTRYLVEEAGVRQFLDVGTGIPTSPNLHEVAQAIAPESRVVYVDNDPIVLTHARALLTSTREGATAYLDADLREPEQIFESAELRDTLDLDQPVALSLIAVIQLLSDDVAYDLIARLLKPLAPGSYLALTVVTNDTDPATARVDAQFTARGITTSARTHAQTEKFFAGLELVEPGVTLVQYWRPDGQVAVADNETGLYAGLARKR
jgi:trans-aconitate methyltransferase